MNDPDARTQPSTTWSRANRIKLCSRGSAKLRKINRRNLFQSCDVVDEVTGVAVRADDQPGQVDPEHTQVADGAQRTRGGA